MAMWGFSDQTITLIRHTGGEYGLDGRWEQGTATETEIQATVNPVPGEILATLPEGERIGKQLRVLTRVRFEVPDEESEEQGDHLLIRGEYYEVRDRAQYDRVIPHFEYRVRKMRPQPEYPEDDD